MTRRERERLIVEDDLATAARAALLAEVAAFDRGDHLAETPADTARIRAAADRLRQLDEVPIHPLPDHVRQALESSDPPGTPDVYEQAAGTSRRKRKDNALRRR